MSLLGDKGRLVQGLSEADRKIFGAELDKLYAMAASLLLGSIGVNPLYFKLAGESNDAPLWNNADFYMYSDNGNTVTNKWANTGIVINEQGADIDVRYEGVGEPFLFVLDAGVPAVQIGTDGTGAGTTADFRLGSIVFNQDQTNQDFRVEGDGEEYLFFTDASTNNVMIGGIPSPAAKLHVHQQSAGTAKPVLLLNQSNVDEDYIKIVGTSDTSVDRALVDAANFTTPGAIKGWLKISVQDDQTTDPITDGDYYIPFYAAPTA